MTDPFPDFIKALPVPDSPVDMVAHIIPNDYALPMFYSIDDDVEIPEHSHGAQWGVVLEGTMTMTIGDDTTEYHRGDTYSVPPGVRHITRIKGGYRGIDVFADHDRYLPKDPQ